MNRISFSCSLMLVCLLSSYSSFKSPHHHNKHLLSASQLLLCMLSLVCSSESHCEIATFSICIWQMKKLSPREVQNFPRVTQLTRDFALRQNCSVDQSPHQRTWVSFIKSARAPWLYEHCASCWTGDILIHLVIFMSFKERFPFSDMSPPLVIQHNTERG